MKTWKKRPQKLLIIGPIFFSVLPKMAQSAQTELFQCFLYLIQIFAHHGVKIMWICFFIFIQIMLFDRIFFKAWTDSWTTYIHSSSLEKSGFIYNTRFFFGSANSDIFRFATWKKGGILANQKTKSSFKLGKLNMYVCSYLILQVLTLKIIRGE